MLTKLVLAIEIEVCTKSQRLKPLNANRGYGMFAVSNRAKLLKMTVKIAVVRTGCSTTQAIPINVCL